MLSYGKSFVDSRRCVHSIDNLVAEYVVKSFSSNIVLDSLSEVFSATIPGWERQKFSKTDLPACSGYSWFRHSIWGGGFYIQYGHYRDFDRVTREWSEYPLLRLKFNPNKYYSSPVLTKLMEWVMANCDNGVLLKFDYAVDVPCPLRDIEVRSRKEPGLYKGTRYYGQRNKHGRLKIYDKKQESGLPDDVSRVEWTLCYGKSIVLDDVFWLSHGPDPLPDAGGLSPQTYTLARLVLMIRASGGCVSDALALMDSRTRKKIEPYTVGSGVQLISGLSTLEDLLWGYCVALSLSFRSDGVNGISVGETIGRISSDDIEGDELPF